MPSEVQTYWPQKLDLLLKYIYIAAWINLIVSTASTVDRLQFIDVFRIKRIEDLTDMIGWMKMSSRHLIDATLVS